MKKYLVLLPIMASCSQLVEYNAGGQDQDNQGQGEVNSRQILYKELKNAIPLLREIKPGMDGYDKYGRNIPATCLYGKMHRDGDDVIGYSIVDDELLLMAVSDGAAEGRSNNGVAGNYANDLVKHFLSCGAGKSMKEMIDYVRLRTWEERDKRAAAAKEARNPDGIGLATFTGVTIDKSGVIKSTITGDSKGILVRGNDVVFETAHQKDLRFNTPYLFRDCKRKMSYRDYYIYSDESINDTKKCTPKTGQAQSNDVFILATDGLWDNLPIPEIIEIIKKYYNGHNDYNLKQKNAQDIANALVQTAKGKFQYSDSKEVTRTPFGDKMLDIWVNKDKYDEDSYEDIDCDVSDSCRSGDWEEENKKWIELCNLRESICKAREEGNINQENKLLEELSQKCEVFKGGKEDDVSVMVTII